MKILSSVSARPNFVKLAAIHHALKKYSKNMEHVIVHTGQHYDPLFSDVFFEQLDIPLPNYNLGIHASDRKKTIDETDASMREILSGEKPDIVLVYGDVNGAVGAARAAHAQKIPLAHVEAGLRSFDLSMPEEHNRIEIDQLAEFLFCSEKSGMNHLEKEGISGEKFLVGNTMIDSLIRMMPLIEAASIPLNMNAPFAVVTMHRPSNVDTKDALQKNIYFLNEIAAKKKLVLPLHHRMKKNLEEFGLKKELLENIKCIEPLGYIPFLKLVTQCDFILTDSGGLQEEATFLKKKCFTLRKNTERPSTLESGSNELIDLENTKDREKVLQFAVESKQSSIVVSELWDGKASDRIISFLHERFSSQ